jgi:hypothetical protein
VGFREALQRLDARVPALTPVDWFCLSFRARHTTRETASEHEEGSRKGSRGQEVRPR